MRAHPLLLLVLLASAPPHPLESAPEILARAAPLVEKACGARFTKPPKALTLTRAAAAKLFREDLRAEVARRHPRASDGQRETLLSAAAEASVDSCVARYSVSAKAVVLVRSGFDRQVKALGVGENARHLLTATLAHECVHALDDVRFDLSHLEAKAGTREAARALAMVVEGRAVHFGRAAAEKLEVPRAVRELLPGGQKPTGYREMLLRLTSQLGERFTAALVRRGGIELADRALREPPRSTHLVCHPDRWPDAAPDARPARLLAKAFPTATVEVLSELELRARYASMDGIEASAGLFAGYRGGAKALVADTNAAVLAFADEPAAARFLARSRKEVPAALRGTLVLRAAGPNAKKLVERMAGLD
ncbi:MAG: hypothetical protein ACYTDY_09705 [Planctomycetota bacterium]|jgi:hypothetical protein